jgi:hypothetical protein
MKKTKYLISCILIIYTLNVSSCDIFSQIGEITIKNNSGQLVTDIVIFVPFFDTESRDTKKIEYLLVNQSMTVSYDLVNSNFLSSARTITGSAGIEYHINGIKFGMDDGNDHSISLINNVDAIVTINADGWVVTTIR